MPCYHPLKALKTAQGVRVLNKDAVLFNLKLPCGQCVGCRLERSRQWALRCIHESKLYENNIFVTLTYDDEHLPHDSGLNHRHFQLFIKRLRKSTTTPIRYYMCGEYGEQNARPHYHAIIFNYTFDDATVWMRTITGSKLYRSKKLESLWTFGFSSFGAVTFESAAYVARYVMKKVTGPNSSSHYQSVSTATGEVHQISPEYNRMSLKPGIGSHWYDKFKSDVFPHDRVIHDGTPSRPPRYYDNKLKKENNQLYDEIKQKRLDKSLLNNDNNDSRLAVKEIVTQAAISQLRRSL
ncbi:MAG: replication initiator protein [Microvirus sp.]|nr:MAG: replication initiator protein [Microvirus sp.]